MVETEFNIGTDSDILEANGYHPEYEPAVEMTLTQFAEILDVGFDHRISSSMVRCLIDRGIIHPLICPRTNSQTLIPQSILPAFIAITIKKISGFTTWIDTARVMAMEGAVRNGVAVRSSQQWLRVAWQAKRLAGIDFDDYPELSPILVSK